METAVKYFRMSFRDSCKATQEVWCRQLAALVPRSGFHTSAKGADASVWTEDKKGEELFRLVLDELQIQYSEATEQQVVTCLDSIFGGNNEHR